jgi:hypothetical protein
MDYLSTEIKSAREAMTIFKILGIKDITTDRQRKNGTQVFEIPKPLRFATYKAGYVRNVSEYNSSPYQINKTKKVTYESGMTGVERIYIDSWEDRLIYLAKFIIKNYYQKPTYLMNDYTIKCLKEAYLEQNKTGLPWCDSVHPESTPENDIQVIINGHRYNLS